MKNGEEKEERMDSRIERGIKKREDLKRMMEVIVKNIKEVKRKSMGEEEIKKEERKEKEEDIVGRN